MGFGDDLKLFAENLDNRLREVFTESTVEVHRSVVEGSEVTGAPGQPVDTGALRASWTPELLSELLWQDSTYLDYAEPIEEGVGPYGQLTLRSAVGGFHSVALTRGGWQRIVEYVREEVVPNG